MFIFNARYHPYWNIFSWYIIIFCIDMYWHVWNIKDLIQQIGNHIIILIISPFLVISNWRQSISSFPQWCKEWLVLPLLFANSHWTISFQQACWKVLFVLLLISSKLNVAHATNVHCTAMNSLAVSFELRRQMKSCQAINTLQAFVLCLCHKVRFQLLVRVKLHSAVTYPYSITNWSGCGSQQAM